MSNCTVRPDLRRDVPIARLKSAGEESWIERLRAFDRVRWAVACRHMQVRVMNGHYEAAHDVLRAFCRVVTKVPATMQSHVCNVLSVRTANALEKAGYITLAAVARASDEQLRRDVANFGEGMLAEVRSVQAAVISGQVHEISEDDEELLDDCLLDALGVLTSDPDKTLAAIDAKIAELHRLRDALQPRPEQEECRA